MQNWLNEVKSIVATFRNMHFIFFNASGPVILDVNQLLFWDPLLPVWMFININMFCLVSVILKGKFLPMKILTGAEVYLKFWDHFRLQNLIFLFIW